MQNGTELFPQATSINHAAYHTAGSRGNATCRMRRRAAQMFTAGVANKSKSARFLLYEAVLLMRSGEIPKKLWNVRTTNRYVAEPYSSMRRRSFDYSKDERAVIAILEVPASTVLMRVDLSIVSRIGSSLCKCHGAPDATKFVADLLVVTYHRVHQQQGIFTMTSQKHN